MANNKEENQPKTNWRFIIVAIGLSIIVSYFCGYFVSQRSVKKESAELIECSEKQNAEKLYLEKLEMQADFIRTLKKYREDIILANFENGRRTSTHIIDDLISERVEKLKEEEFKFFEIPEMDEKKFKASEDSYLVHTYFPELEKLIFKFRNSYSINKQIVERLKEMETEYEDEIEQSSTYEKMYDLMDECSYNLELFEVK